MVIPDEEKTKYIVNTHSFYVSTTYKPGKFDLMLYYTYVNALRDFYVIPNPEKVLSLLLVETFRLLTYETFCRILLCNFVAAVFGVVAGGTFVARENCATKICNKSLVCCRP